MYFTDKDLYWRKRPLVLFAKIFALISFTNIQYKCALKYDCLKNAQLRLPKRRAQADACARQPDEFFQLIIHPS